MLCIVLCCTVLYSLRYATGRGYYLASSYKYNCLTFDKKTCPKTPQRSAADCKRFCRADTGRACGGRGYCTTRVNGYPRCVCDAGFEVTADGQSCVAAKKKK